MSWFDDKRADSALERIAHELHEIAHLLRRLVGKHAQSATLSFITSQGETIMPLTVHLNDKPGTAKYQEFDGLAGTGNKVPPTGVVAYASDTPTVATVDPVTGALVYVSAGTAKISASDGGNLPASDVLTVVASVAVSATLTLNPGV
jgi:hypothetical protein